MSPSALLATGIHGGALTPSPNPTTPTYPADMTFVFFCHMHGGGGGGGGLCVTGISVSRPRVQHCPPTPISFRCSFPSHPAELSHQDCGRTNVSFKAVRGPIRRPKDKLEFALYAPIEAPTELFKGWRWADEPGPAAGPRDKFGNPAPLLVASFKCAALRCGGTCGFKM